MLKPSLPLWGLQLVLVCVQQKSAEQVFEARALGVKHMLSIRIGMYIYVRIR